MTESKKKSSWISWVVVAAIYVVLVIYLMMYMRNECRDNAREAVYDNLLTRVSVWGETIERDVKHSNECGGIVLNTIEEDGLDIFSPEVVKLIHRMKENTTYFRVCIVDTNDKMVDDNGEECDITPYKFYLNGKETKEQRVLLLNSDDAGNNKVVVTTYPLKTGFLMFFLEVDDVVNTFETVDFEKTSFGVLIRKDGTVLKTFKKFADSNSKFITGTNLLNAIQKGTSKDDYNEFRIKLFQAPVSGSVGCAVASVYEDDERTLVFAPLGTEDWYICVGFRQYEVNQMIYSRIDSIRSTAIKLMVSMLIFIFFSVGFLLFNLSKTKEKGKRLEDKADTDLLTELTNKAATERMISEYIENFPDGRGVLFILDIDNFKKVNDTMGHAFGDVLLKTLGKQIKTEFRVTDIVGRTGGDEFMVFLKDIKDDQIVEREANRVTQFFKDFKAGDGYVKYSASASIGVSIFPDDGKTFKELYVSADQALYRAKKRGKNQLVFFNEEKYGNK